MLDFKWLYNPKTHEEWIETSLCGKPLLTTPQLNKGTAFSEQERHDFGLRGKLPVRVESLEEQAMRAYLQFQSYGNKLQKNIYLNNLHDTNQVLFYQLIKNHLSEMMPTIYTPIVGTRIKESSREFRHPRGLYITILDQHNIDEILDNRSNPQIDLIVVTDGEGVLGIGDQGVGAMDIPIAKLMVYTICGGINPLRTLPILLDVGTNNQQLLDDPLYLGLRHPRITGKEYDDFIAAFVAGIKRKFPKAFLHWEDFGRHNARRNLDRFRDTLCSFNDDIQGTGVVTVAALLAAVKATHSRLQDQRIVIFGAGTAGMGIADQICAAIMREGVSEAAAKACFWVIDKEGLLLTSSKTLTPEQIPYARAPEEIHAWGLGPHSSISLSDVVAFVKSTVLIGSSSVAGAFSESIVKKMAQQVARPIIFPLSNPTERAEATPQDLLNWTQGTAIIATGSPFDDVVWNGVSVPVAQCNNALAFPGIGLGIIASKAKKLTDDMLWAACEALSQTAPILKNPHAPVLPPLAAANQVAHDIAVAVAMKAGGENVEEAIQQTKWSPHYVDYKLKR